MTDHLKRLLSEVIRRRMPQTVGGYLVLVITILTGADLLFPGLPVPEGLYQVLVIVFVALFPAVIGLSWFYDITKHGIQKTLSFEQHAANAGSANMAIQNEKLSANDTECLKLGAIESVAVLPFVNSSNDEEGEYLSDGITETIINMLAKLSDVRVIPRASSFRYKNSDLTALTICNELNVQTSVSGSINHFGDRLVVQAELVDPKRESQIWGERYNALWKNLFDVQEEIATKISSSLKPELSVDEKSKLKHRETHHLGAYQDYLHGRFLWNKRTPEGLLQSIDYFQAAIEKDSLYALAYSGLADAYNILGYYSIESPADSYPLAKEADRKALEFEPDLAEAHASLGYANLFYDRDWETARKNFTRAIELNPDYGTAHQWYAWYMLVMERHDEALASFQRAIELDPLSQIINDHLAYGYMLTGQMKQARKQIDRTRVLAPNYPLALWRLGDWHGLEGNLEQAAEAYSEAEVLGGGRYTLGYLGLTYGLMGRTTEARQVLARMDVYEKERYVSPLDRAFVHAGLNQSDETFRYIEHATNIRVSDMARFKLLPWPDAIRNDARFAEKTNDLKLPA